MQYSVELYKNGTRVFQTRVTSCREETLRYTIEQIKASKIDPKRINDYDVVFLMTAYDYSYGIPLHLENDIAGRKEALLKFMQFFTDRFVRQCSVSNQFSLTPKTSIMVSNADSGSYTGTKYSISIQGFCLNNPYFINFYLGCIRTIYSYLANPAVSAEYKKLAEMKTYTEMLKTAAVAVNEDFPTKTEFQKKRKAFFRAFEKAELLHQVMTEYKATTYGNQMKYNGFRTWYEGEGRLLAEDQPTEVIETAPEQPITVPF